jgi:hypothetical protein
MSKRISIIALLLTFLVGQHAWGQRPIYRRSPIEEKKSRIGFAMRTLIGVDLELRDLGTVGFPTPQNPSQLGDLEGKELEFFNDGYIVYDPAADETMEFAFAWANASTYSDPLSFNQEDLLTNGFTLNRFQTTTTGSGATADNTSQYGWEFFYDYKWGKAEDRFRLGFRVGMGLQNLDYSYIGTVDAMRNQQVLVVSIPDGTLSNPITFVQADPGNDGGSGALFYVGREDSGAAAIINPAMIDFTQGVLTEGTIQEVDAAFDYDGVMALLRIGPTLDLKIFEDLHLELSAGIAGAYLFSRINLSQRFDFSLRLPVVTSTQVAPDNFFEERTELLVGFFAEGLLRYQITPRVGFFSSMMYLSLPDVDDPTIGTAQYNLSLSSPILASAGLLLSF